MTRRSFGEMREFLRNNPQFRREKKEPPFRSEKVLAEMLNEMLRRADPLITDVELAADGGGIDQSVVGVNADHHGPTIEETLGRWSKDPDISDSMEYRADE